MKQILVIFSLSSHFPPFFVVVTLPLLDHAKKIFLKIRARTRKLKISAAANQTLFKKWQILTQQANLIMQRKWTYKYQRRWIQGIILKNIFVYFRNRHKWHAKKYLKVDMWPVTNDQWCELNKVSKFLLFTSNGLGVMIFWRSGGKGWISDFNNQWQSCL